MAIATLEAHTLPRSLRTALSRIEQRRRAAAALRGIGLTLIIVFICAIVGMLLDFLWPLPAAARWGVWASSILAVAATIYSTIYWPAFRRANLLNLAAAAELKAGDLGERLTSAVDLSRENAHGSPGLIAALTRQADERAANVEASRIIPLRGSARTLAIGVGLLASLIVAARIVPDPVGSLWNRFLAPWKDLDPAGRFIVEVVCPGDSIASLGSSVVFSAKVRSRLNFDRGALPDKVLLEWTGTTGKAQRALMAPETSDQSPNTGGRYFALTLPRIERSISYRVVASPARSRLYQVRAVEPPAIIELSAEVVPPAYTKLREYRPRHPDRVIEAPEAGRVKIGFKTNHPARSFDFRWPAAPENDNGSAIITQPPARPSADRRTWTFDAEAAVSGMVALSFIDENGFEYKHDPAIRLLVRPDAPPRITLGGSNDARDARPDDFLIVNLAAIDDYGIASADLMYTIQHAGTAGEETGQVAAAVAGMNTRVARGQAALRLQALNLKPADVVTYHLRVADNYPPPKGPHVVRSAARVLKIVENARPLADQDDATERSEMQSRLDAIKKSVTETRQGTEQLRYAADAVSRGNGQWDDDRDRDLAARANAMRSSIDALQLLARDAAESSRFAPLARPLKAAAEVEAAGSHERLNAARQAKEAAARLDDLRQADSRLSALQSRLDEIQRQLDEVNRRGDDRRKLRELAEKQAELGSRAEEVARNGDRAELDRIQAEQDRLRWQVDEIIRNSPELRAEALASRADEADRLARQLRELADQQREEARKTADNGGRARALNELAEAQRAIEQDARALALQTDPALQENGRGAIDVHAIRRAIEPLDKGDVASASQQLQSGEETLRRAERDLDEIRTDPKTLARRLARRMDVLIGPANDAANAARNSKAPDDRDRALKGFEPLAARAAAIAKLAGAIPFADAQQGQARDAARTTAQARDDLQQRRVDGVPGHLNEARDSLNRLADALPDANQVRQEARNRLGDARNRTEEVAREIERHLRETSPQPGKPADPDGSAAELARRLVPLVQRQSEAAKALSALSVQRRDEPQRDRAARRTQALADALDQIARQAPPESRIDPAIPITGWRLLGPFSHRDQPPFPLGQPIDFKAAFKGRNDKPVVWKAHQADATGLVDLIRVYSADSDQTAFGAAEIVSPRAGRGRLAIGSDDTIRIWLNGKQVFDYPGNRGFSAGQDRVDVAILEGFNRLVVKCGNGSGEWKYAVSVSMPPHTDPRSDLTLVRKLRDSLPAATADARASQERLEQALSGRQPADQVAAELAEELARIQADAANRARQNEQRAQDATALEMRRIAAALRGLNAADGAEQQAEAVRRVEEAASAAAERRDSADTLNRATVAAANLAKRLSEAPGDAKPAPARPEAPHDPDLRSPAELSERANDLARRERHVREQLQAILGERIAPQEHLRQQALDSGKSLAELRDSTRDLSQRSQGPANAASDIMQNHAPGAMRQSAEHLAQSRPDPARDEQRRAAELVERAAGQAQDIAAALRADLPPDGQPANQPQAASDLAAARDAQRAASQELTHARQQQDQGQSANSSSSAKSASERMRQAADGLRTASLPKPGGKATSEQAGGGQPEPNALDPHDQVGQPVEPSLAKLQDALKAKTGRRWGELPGHLKTEILQMAQGRYRDDYARLIQLYFQEIAVDKPASAPR